MTTWPTAASSVGRPRRCSPLLSPGRSATFARISAVQQMIGASGLTAESPVIMPTFFEPNAATRAKNFSLTSALSGAV